MTDFFDKEPEKLVAQLKEVLYDRLKVVRRAANMKVPLDDDFELGVNYSLAHQAEWLEDLLDKIERS